MTWFSSTPTGCGSSSRAGVDESGHRHAAVAISTALTALALVFGALPGLPSPRAQAAELCWNGVFSDIDGGGPDVVVGYPSWDLPGKPDAGAIAVFSDVAERLSPLPRAPRRATLLTADDIPGLAAQTGARFGAAVVMAPDRLDDPDTCADLWVGVPGQTVGGQAAAGQVVLLNGRSGGPVLNRVIDLAGLSASDGPQAGAGFGSSLAVETGTTLAIGEPGRDIDGIVDAGRVIRLDDIDSEDGATYSVVQQGGDGAGTLEAGDRFGEVLALKPTGAGTLLLIGIPGEDVGSRRDAGAVALQPRVGTLSLITQNSPGAGGVAEAGDRYGAAVDVHASFADNHPIELVTIGVPGEDVGRVRDAGALSYGRIDLFADSPTSVSALRGLAPTLTQDSPGVAGVMEPGDAFGHAVVSAELGLSSGRQHIAATAPGEDVGSRRDAGGLFMAAVDEATGLPVAGRQPGAWTQDSDGVSGVAEIGDHFGARATAVQLTRNVTEGDDEDEPGWPITLVTVPGEDRLGRADAGMAYLGVAPGAGSVPLALPDLQVGSGTGMVGMELALADL